MGMVGLPPPAPIGLSVLTTISQIFIKQRIDVLQGTKNILICIKY